MSDVPATGARTTSARGLAAAWMRVGANMLPFADVASADLPLGRLLRLSLFQVSVGMAIVLLIGTLNRVMIVELGVPVWLVAGMIALPLVFAPFRAVIGFKSDTHRSHLGWRRVPYLWFGTLLQFGGLAIMPFALILLGGDSAVHAPAWVGQLAAGLSFLLIGAGLHTVQTAGLALATDLAPQRDHPKVVALLCVMMMAGMMVAALLFGALLATFSELRLIKVVQGAGAFTMVINLAAMWKQEPRGGRQANADVAQTFAASWAMLAAKGSPVRRLVAVGLGTMAFSMQDVLLEPYGGQVLHLSVGATTGLTAILAVGGLAGFLLAARRLGRGTDPYRFAAAGTLIGLAAFATLILAAPLASVVLFAGGVALVGFGSGIFAHCTLTAAMGLAQAGQSGTVLGIWGAVQASAAGVAVAAGGFIRDGVAALAGSCALGRAMTGASVGYSTVYACEIGLLVATLLALGPLLRVGRRVTVAAA